MAGSVDVQMWLVSERFGVVAAVAALVMGFVRVYIAPLPGFFGCVR
jgi:hypothetical protein